jgi:hypothetical protein
VIGTWLCGATRLLAIVSSRDGSTPPNVKTKADARTIKRVTQALTALVSGLLVLAGVIIRRLGLR